MRCPNIVHQIWLQGWEERPAKFNANIDALRTMNQDFVFMTWDENTLAREALRISPACWDRFRSFPHLISKVDFGRYIVLYNYGGISVDLDMKSLKPIRETPELDNHDFIVSGSAFPINTLGFINNAVFFVTPKHPLMRALIDEIIAQKATPADYISREAYIMDTTGPYRVSKFIHAHPDEIYVLDNRYYEPCVSTDPLCSVDVATIMDHQHEQSWASEWYRQVQRFLFVIARLWWVVLAVTVVLIAYVYQPPKRIMWIVR
jgi:mannosyltransferase OCH1-like enzyme